MLLPRSLRHRQNRQLRCLFLSTSPTLLLDLELLDCHATPFACLVTCLPRKAIRSQFTVAAAFHSSPPYAVGIWRLFSRRLLLREIVYASTWESWVAPSEFNTFSRTHLLQSIAPATTIAGTHQESQRHCVLSRHVHIHIKPYTIPFGARSRYINLINPRSAISPRQLIARTTTVHYLRPIQAWAVHGR